MDIFLHINNREQVIQLPVVPESFSISSPMNNSTFNSVSQGDLKLIGLRGLKSLTIDTFFPVKDYPFLRSRQYWGWEYVEIIESWIDRRLPIGLTITETPIILPMVIDSFQYGVEDGSGDIYYSLTLEEFRFVPLPQRQV